MIPGKGPARLSEEIQALADPLPSPRSDIVIITGTGTINTIPPPFGGFTYGLHITLIPTNAAGITLGAAGNILVGIAIAQNRSQGLTWSKSQQKWFIDL